MCGIICAISKDKTPVNGFVIDQFEDQQSRGIKGFGIIDIDMETKEYKISRATEPAKFMFDLHKKESSAMIVHHRYPTSSPNFMSQTHPISVDNGSLKHKYLVIHNGCISNDKTLKKEHEELGFIYTTDIDIVDQWKREEQKFNDSECLSIEVARFIEKQSEEVGILGSAAFIAVQIDKKTDKIQNIFFGRNTNPLHMCFTRGKLRLSSEGEGDDIKPNVLYSWDMKATNLKKRDMKFKTIAPATYQTYQHQTAIGFQDKGNLTTHTRENDYAYPYRDESYYKDMPWEDKVDDEEIEQIVEFRQEEAQKELEDFFDYIADSELAITADIENTLKDIRSILLIAKSEAVKAHQDREMNEELEIENYNKSYSQSV